MRVSRGARRRQAVAFAMAFGRYAVGPALTRAFPLLAGTLALGSTLLDGGALRSLAEVSPALPVLALAWVLALTRARAALLGTPATEYLRAMPVPRPLVTAAVLLALAALDAPWIWACASSGDLGVMAAGPMLTAAGHVALASRRPAAIFAVMLLAAAAALVPAGLVALPALALAVWGVPWAWTVAEKVRRARRPRGYAAVPTLGLARALAAAVVRADHQLMRRAAVLLAVTSAVSALAIRNNQLRTVTTAAPACLVPLVLALPLLLTRVSTGVLETGWRLGWLCNTTGTGRRPRATAGVLTTGAAGAGIGAAHGLAVSLVTAPALVSYLVPLALLVGGSAGVLALGVAAACARRGSIDAIRQATVTIATSVAAAFAVAGDLRLTGLAAVPILVLAVALFVARLDCDEVNRC